MRECEDSNYRAQAEALVARFFALDKDCAAEWERVQVAVEFLRAAGEQAATEALRPIREYVDEYGCPHCGDCGDVRHIPDGCPIAEALHRRPRTEVFEAIWFWGCVQTILFRSGLFYGHPVGQAEFAREYPNGCPPPRRPREEK